MSTQPKCKVQIRQLDGSWKTIGEFTSFELRYEKEWDSDQVYTLPRPVEIILHEENPYLPKGFNCMCNLNHPSVQSHDAQVCTCSCHYENRPAVLYGEPK